MIVPLLELKTPEGSPAPWQALWQRKNLLLLIADKDCGACQRVLEGWQPHLEEEDAAAVAIYPEPPKEEVPDETVVLLDPEGRMASYLKVEPGTAIAADRYFSIRSTQDIHELGAEEVAKDTMEWIDLAERTCDECGAPTW